jgi:hypothetical protein
LSKFRPKKSAKKRQKSAKKAPKAPKSAKKRQKSAKKAPKNAKSAKKGAKNCPTFAAKRSLMHYKELLPGEVTGLNL